MCVYVVVCPYHVLHEQYIGRSSTSSAFLSVCLSVSEAVPVSYEVCVFT